MPITSIITVFIVEILVIYSSAQVSPICPSNDQQITKLPHLNCSKYYKCYLGELIEQNCPYPLHWNMEISSCDWPDSAKCIENINSIEKTERLPITKTPQTPPTRAPQNNSCPWHDDPLRPVHLPHPDCTKYYICFLGEATVQICPPPLHWNIAADWCDWPEEANCTDNEAPPQPTASPPTATQPTSPPPTNTPPTRPPNNGSCPSYDDPQNPIHLPHPDCTKYYICVLGVAQEMNCAPPLHWNIEANWCDWSWAANCTENEAAPQPTARPPTTVTIPTTQPTEITTDATPETTADTTLDTTIETTPESTPDTTSETTPITTPDITTITTPGTTLDTTLDTTQDTTIDTTSDTTPDTTLDITLETTQETTIHTTSEIPDTTQDTTTMSTPETTEDATPSSQPDTTPDTTLETTQSSSPSITPDTTTQTSSETIPETTQDTTTDITPDTSPETVPDTTPETTPDTTTQITSETMPDTTTIATSDTTQDTTPDTTSSSEPDTTPDTTLDSSPEITPDTSPIATSDTTQETTPETTPDTTTQTTSETMPDSTTIATSDTTENTTPDVTSSSVQDTTVDTTPDTTPEYSPEITPDTSPETIPDTTTQTTSETIPDTTANTTSGTTQNTTPDTTSSSEPDTTEDTTPDTTSDSSPEITPDTTPNTTTDSSPSITPDTTTTTPDTTIDTTRDSTVDTTQDSTVDTTIDTTTQTTSETIPETTPTMTSDTTTQTTSETIPDTTQDTTAIVTSDATPDTTEDTTTKTTQIPTLETTQNTPSSELPITTERPETSTLTEVSTTSDVPDTSTPSQTTLPNNGSCPLDDDEQNLAHLPHPDCTKFYKCYLGEAVEQNCPPNLHWNIASDTCDWPELANCTDNEAPPQPTARPTTISTIDPSTTTELPNTSATPSETIPDITVTLETTIIPETTIPPETTIVIPTPSTAPATSTTTVKPTTILPNNGTCPIDHDPDNIIYLPHPDCKKYYKCEDGGAVEEKCPSKKYWNKLKNRCDDKDKAKCKDKEAPSQPTIPPVIARCPLIDDPKNPTYLPHPDCKKFYKCYAGGAIEQNCPKNLYWDKINNKCDEKKKAKCKDKEAPSQPTIPPIIARCPLIDDPDNPTFLPHPDCKKYYKCHLGGAIQQKCPDKLNWDKINNQCDIRYVANCKDNEAPSQPTIRPPTNIDRCPHHYDPKHPIYLAHPDCKKYYICMRGGAVEHKCRSYLYWDKIHNKCTEKYAAKCRDHEAPHQPTVRPHKISICALNDDESIPTYSPHLECNKYYKCIDGMAVEQNCPPKFHWNAEINGCVWELLSKCT